jgi:hypothetical protein
VGAQARYAKEREMVRGDSYANGNSNGQEPEDNGGPGDVRHGLRVRVFLLPGRRGHAADERVRKVRRLAGLAVAAALVVLGLPAAAQAQDTSYYVIASNDYPPDAIQAASSNGAQVIISEDFTTFSRGDFTDHDGIGYYAYKDSETGWCLVTAALSRNGPIRNPRPTPC